MASPDAAESALFESPQARRRFVVHLLVAAMVVAGATLLLRRQVPLLFDRRAVAAWIAGTGALAPLALIAVQALQVVVAPIPGQVLAAVAGYLFGPWWGTLYNMIGVTIGSAVAFWLARRFGRAYVERMVDPGVLASFDEVIEGYGVVGLFLVFLVPGLPDDVLCLVGGLTAIPLWKLVLVAVVGRFPGFFLANVLGYLVATDERWAAVGLVVVLALAGAIGYLERDRVLGLFE
ncbi:MAG: TVP38/TMEM64 family protein [Halanaeroarchaeum sp.]